MEKVSKYHHRVSDYLRLLLQGGIMKYFRLSIIILMLFFILPFSPAEAAQSNLTEHHVKVNENFSFSQREFRLEDKGWFFIRKISSSADEIYMTSFEIPGNEGFIRYFDSNGSLIQKELISGVMPSSGLVFISTERYNYLLGQPYSYKDLSAGTVQSISSHSISISKGIDKWVVTYRFKLQAGSFGMMWGVGSSYPLVDLSNRYQQVIWGNYDLDKNARLLYDGYHYMSPSTYKPYMPGAYWRIPSDYLTNSLIKTGGSTAADILGNALLKVAHGNINAEGYLPSLPRSLWLYDDYGIDGGFFDTRFNADTLETNIVAYRKFGDPSFRDASIKLAEYYLMHGSTRNLVNYDYFGDEGWLVEDYYAQGGNPTHISLNHQLQAIHAFYLLYEDEKDERFLEFADKMLQGIKNTTHRWIMQDGNLEYAILQNGQMGFKDYDYLTYNDLLKVQDDLVRLKGQRDPDLDALIQSKKLWMDSNGITGYRKW